MKKYLFTYGTLMDKQSNNRLLSSSKLIGEATVEGYKLFNSGFPVATKNEGTKVIGEIWEVDTEETWRRLDGLEGYPYMYGRDTVKADLYNIGVDGHFECQMYVGNPDSWRGFKTMTECPKNDGVYQWPRRTL